MFTITVRDSKYYVNFIFDVIKPNGEKNHIVITFRPNIKTQPIDFIFEAIVLTLGREFGYIKLSDIALTKIKEAIFDLKCQYLNLRILTKKQKGE